jgi:hypothetical protein
MTTSWPGMRATMRAHSASSGMVAIIAICPGAEIQVSVAPARRWRHESFPGTSMSKPTWPWCLTVPTSKPRAVSSATARSTIVVFPEL